MSCFKALCFVLSFAIFNGMAFAQNGQSEDAPVVVDPVYKNKEWLKNSSKTIDEAAKASQNPPEWLKGNIPESAIKAAEKLKKRSDIVIQGLSEGKSVQQVVKEWKQPEIAEKKFDPKLADLDLKLGDDDLPRSYIFVSQSMPEAELKAAIEESNESGATIVYRGIKPGQAIDHISFLIQGILKKNPELKPNVVIDPNLYKLYGVEIVPSVVVHYNGTLIKAAGTLSVDYLLEQLAQNKNGYIGVVEPDLIDELKRRAELLDWDKIKNGATDRFWTDEWQDFNLATAEKNDAFLVDPTFTVKEDFVALGRVGIKAGTKYNPQKILPMRQVYFIFNGEDKRQIQAVKTYIKKKKIPSDLAILIVSALDRSRGFAAIGELSASFGAQVYILDKLVMDRFKLKVVPSVVYGSGDFYKVEELGIRNKND